MELILGNKSRKISQEKMFFFVEKYSSPYGKRILLIGTENEKL